jgi:hypothetical protein
VYFFLNTATIALILFKFKRIPFKEPQFTGVGGYTYMKL